MLATRRAGLVLVLALSAPARARDLWTDGESGVSLRTSLKGAALVQRAPDAPLLFPEREAASSLWRLRLDAARLAREVLIEEARELGVVIEVEEGRAPAPAAVVGAGGRAFVQKFPPSRP